MQFSVQQQNERKRSYFDGKDLTQRREKRALKEIEMPNPLFYFRKTGKVELLIIQIHLSIRIDTIETCEGSSATTLVFNCITVTVLKKCKTCKTQLRINS